MRAALVEHAGLAGLGQQLGVEAGVLLERRLEPGHRDAPLLALLGQPLADEHADPDRERLDDDDRDVDRPPLGGVGEPAEHRVDDDRRGEDAQDQDRPRPQDRGVEEPGDQEDEEQVVARGQHGADRQQADEVQAHPQVMGPPRLRRPGVAEVHPQRRDRDEARRHQALADGLGREGERQDRRDRQGDVRAPVGQPVRPSLVRRSARRRRRRCGRPAHSHRNRRAATVPATTVITAIAASWAGCGDVPCQASSRAWTPGGV